VIHRIAFGGMAEIYLALASGIQGFEKYVVLKRILPQYATNPDLVRMFLQEARLAALLDHANIAQVHDIGEESGAFFFTMEYLHGEDVRRIAKQLGQRGDPIPLEHAVHIVIDAAAGLHFAHERKGPDGASLGIVHRDLSPSNIVVTYAGGVKVVDFGVAKIAANPELSGRYSLKGKLAYMSPEQIAQGPVDRRSDVYTLGIVLYELTTRSRLFKAANDVETMQLALEAKVAHPSTIVPDYPPELARIVLRALARSPEKRYQTARDLQIDLEGFARDQKLEISSAALAEWLEGTFGPKREIWHILPGLAGQADGLDALAAGENTAATRKVSEKDLAKLPPDLLEAVRPGRARPRAAIAAVTLSLLVLLIGGGAFAWRHRSAPDPSPRHAAESAGGQVLVVAENGSVAIEQGGVPAAPGASAQAVGSLPPERVPAAPETPPRTRARGGRPARAPAGSDPLSSAVAKRAADIQRCFTELGAETRPSGEVALRFEVGVDGSVKSIVVLPPAIGSTPLGACLVKVGRGTTFAPQPEPITFRIPLTVQMRRQELGR
jgi:tRNA A-37 threonylcarbamoyl transferase component Bud32